MAIFTVTHIIDGDTIRVSPSWLWSGKQGDIVKVLGYTTPVEANAAYATNKLRNLLLNRQIELKNPQLYNQGSDAIACRVFLNNVDISKYFPEFQTRR